MDPCQEKLRRWGCDPKFTGSGPRFNVKTVLQELTRSEIPPHHDVSPHRGPLIYIYVYLHYNDVIMSAMASQITGLTIVYPSVYSGADQRKYQSSASLAFVRGIHRRPVNSPHKGPVLSNAENVSIWWRHHVCIWCHYVSSSYVSVNA